MKYSELKAKHEQIRNDFTGIFYAFSNKQFEEGMVKVGLEDTEEDRKQIASIGSGGFMLKSQGKAFQSMLNDFGKDMEAMKANPAQLTEALNYELDNHEYCITVDPTDALECFGLTIDTVDPAILREAIKGTYQYA